MRLGLALQSQGLTLDELISRVRAAADAGLDSAYLNQLTSWDAIGVAGICAREVPGIDVGSAVTPTYPRHPLALAGQALTTQAIARGRFVLGVGPSHRQMIEDWYGHSYDRPARHVREYLTVLGPLLRGEPVDHHGPALTAVGSAVVPGVTAPPVLLSALGPRMLRIAGELADGTVTLMTGPKVVGEYIVPEITRAAAGRAAPRVVVGVFMALTSDPDGLRNQLAGELGAAGDLPAYRAILDRQGAAGVADLMVAGDERTLERAVRAYADAGATELAVSVHGDERERARLLELLPELRA
jgi:F420-dependent oxidoreductase-like protein